MTTFNDGESAEDFYLITPHQLYSWIQKIDQWENDSIEKIKQTAEECRNRLINYTNKFFIQLKDKKNHLVTEFKRIRRENEFNEINLNKLKNKLNKLKQEFDKLKKISIEEQSTLFIKKIFVRDSEYQNLIFELFYYFHPDTIWQQHGIHIAGRNGQGNQFDQLSYPHGLFIDDDQTIYIADWKNNRIVQWESNATNGQIVASRNQLNGPTDVLIDRENDCLIIADCGNRRVMQWSRQNNMDEEIIISDIDCRGLAMDKDRSLYVSDYVKNEVRRWKNGEKGEGTIVAGGNGEGDQLNWPTYIFVDDDYSLFVSDHLNHRVMKWVKDAKEGIVVGGGNGKGESLRQLSSPQGVIVDQMGQIYVADWGNHRVMRWSEGANEGMIVVGGNEYGQQSNQFSYPRGLSFDRQGHLYVVDCWNHRIQKFNVDLD